MSEKKDNDKGYRKGYEDDSRQKIDRSDNYSNEERKDKYEPVTESYEPTVDKLDDSNPPSKDSSS